MTTKKIIVVLIVSLIAVGMGCMALYYPKEGKTITGFSCERAQKDIETIAKKPHSTLYHQRELSEVREYIVSEMKKLDISPEVFQYNNVMNSKGQVANLNNIYGKIDGKQGEEGNYILLVSHYDSAGTNPQNDDGYSFGAADAGYGVSTILEVLRNIKEDQKQLVNGIKVLITDGEELRLMGSEEEIENNKSLYKNVSCMINLEARGTKGPVLMYETSENSSRIVDFFKKSVNPITTSFITDLYRGSDRSDFYNLKKMGIPGANFIVLDGVENYHTPGDSAENIDQSTLQHYGAQILPMVEEYVYSDKYIDHSYFSDGSKSIFFTLFPNMLIQYSAKLGMIFSVIIVGMVTYILFCNRILLIDVLKEVGKWIIWVVGLSILGVGISFVLSKLSGVNFTLAHMGKVFGDDILVWVLPTIVLISFLLKKGRAGSEVMVLSGLLMQSFLLLSCTIWLPGASYLVLIPIVFQLVAYFVDTYITKRGVWFIYLLPYLVTIWIFIPVIGILNIVFSIGSLAFTFVFVAIMILNIRADFHKIQEMY